MRIAQLQTAVPQLTLSLQAAKDAVVAAETALAQARQAEKLANSRESNHLRIAGWCGPVGFRLATTETRSNKCACCGRLIPGGQQHVQWRIPQIPASTGEFDENRRWAHPECLLALTQAYQKRYKGVELPYDYRGKVCNAAGVAWPEGLWFIPQAIPDNVQYHHYFHS